MLALCKLETCIRLYKKHLHGTFFFAQDLQEDGTIFFCRLIFKRKGLVWRAMTKKRDKVCGSERERVLCWNCFVFIFPDILLI